MTDQHQNHLDQAESLAGEYAHNGHRSRHRVSHHTRKRVILLGMLLALALMVVVAESIYISVVVGKLKEKNALLTQGLDDSQQFAEQQRELLKQANNELALLKAGRFPQLSPFQLNQLIELPNPQLRHIMFTRTKRGDSAFFEYQMLVENDTDAGFRPDFRILLFDRLGLHVGTVQLQDTSTLAIGESQRYSGRIDMLLANPPKHFMVDAGKADLASNE